MKAILSKEIVREVLNQLRAEGRIKPGEEPTLTTVWNRCGARGSMSTVRKFLKEIAADSTPTDPSVALDASLNQQVMALIQKTRAEDRASAEARFQPQLSELEQALAALEVALDSKCGELDAAERRAVSLEESRDAALADLRIAREEATAARAELSESLRRLVAEKELYTQATKHLQDQLDAAREELRHLLAEKESALRQVAELKAVQSLTEAHLAEVKSRLALFEARLLEQFSGPRARETDATCAVTASPLSHPLNA